MDKVHEVSQEAERFNVRALDVVRDLSKRDNVKVDMLVNNAGIYPFKPFLEMSGED